MWPKVTPERRLALREERFAASRKWQEAPEGWWRPLHGFVVLVRKTESGFIPGVAVDGVWQWLGEPVATEDEARRVAFRAVDPMKPPQAAKPELSDDERALIRALRDTDAADDRIEWEEDTFTEEDRASFREAAEEVERDARELVRNARAEGIPIYSHLPAKAPPVPEGSRD